MVERTIELDTVFHSLADQTRRDILRRVMHKELSITQIAKAYQKRMSLAAVSKHVKVLEHSGLVKKRRDGKQHLIVSSPAALLNASEYLEQYKKLWGERLDRLEEYIKK